MSGPFQRLATSSIACALLFVLAGCGAGAGVDAGKPASADTVSRSLTIVAQDLPSGQVESAYPSTTLEATGAFGPVVWSVAGGTLPPGLTLTSAGVLSGAPSTEGVYEFDVAADDGRSTDVGRFALAVDAFGVTVGGLRFGEVWGGEPISLDAVGLQGTVSFEVVGNGSGGAFDALDGTTGHATWIPGDADAETYDTIRATDEASGRTSEVTLDVLPNPAPDMRAEFGSTDVWYVDDKPRMGTHPYARDWDQVLVILGLRGQQTEPTMADRLADYYTRRQVLSELNLYFGRNPDGTRGSGLAISFPMDEPGSRYSRPARGGWSSPAPDRYNVIGIVNGTNPVVLGMAFVDSQSNAVMENDTSPNEQDQLGVFANQVARTYNAAFQNNTLPADPVGPADEAVLRDLVHGRPTSGLRAYLIQRAATRFAHAVAMILAHEIGHSLGLVHTNPVQSGSIMNGGAAIYPGAVYTFTDSDLAILRGGLPGPGRIGAATKSADGASPAPVGGVQACRLHLVSCPVCGHVSVRQETLPR